MKLSSVAATFGWLCVETSRFLAVVTLLWCSHLRVAVCWNKSFSCGSNFTLVQPPSGGCVLKLWILSPVHWLKWEQPPSGGCVLKRFANEDTVVFYLQPPSGGCVLKPNVENKPVAKSAQPPSGGCVLKLCIIVSLAHFCMQPPSGGCVLKLLWKN